MKLTKKLKALAIALPMLLLSVAGSITGTVAWFTAANIVNVSGMNIQAETEQGIVISNEDKTTWGTSATAKYNSAVSVLPTSTADATTWYRNNSTDENIYGGEGHIGTYLAYTANDADTVKRFTVTNGVGSIDIDQSTATTDDSKNIFLLNKFYIKSTTNAALADQKLYVNSVKIDNESVALHDAVRVLVKSGSAVKIYKTSGGAGTYGVNGATTGVTATTEADPINDELLVLTTIPANDTTTPLEIEVYAYFEGEDPKCTSTNANATNALNSLAVSLQFGTKQKA